MNPSLAGGKLKARSAFPVLTAQSGLAGTIASPYFSPHTNHGERLLDTNSRFALPTVAPGQNPGVLRIASSVLHILPQTTVTPDLRRSSSPRDRAKGSAGTFQRGKFPAFNATAVTGNAFLKSSTTSSHTTLLNSRHTPSLD